VRCIKHRPTVWPLLLEHMRSSSSMLCDFEEEDFVVSPLLLLSYFYRPLCRLQELGCLGSECGSLRFLSHLFSQTYTPCLQCGLDTHAVKIVQSPRVSTVISELHTNHPYQHPRTSLQQSNLFSEVGMCKSGC